MLKLAGAVSHAIEAVVGMIGQEQFDDRLPRLDRPRRMRLHLHAVGDGKRATGDQTALALHLDHAHPARAAGRQAVQMAERGHADARTPQSGQKHFILFGLNRMAVDFESYHGVVSCKKSLFPGSAWEHTGFEALPR
jgi:hypothetical protein